MEKMLVIDVGGTMIKAAILSSDGNFFQDLPTYPTPDNLHDFIAVIKKMKASCSESILGLALSMPGVIHPETGHVTHAGSIQYIKEMNLKERLEQELDCPISIFNDAKAAVLAESKFGKLINYQNALSIVLGTGVGMGILIDGKIYQGHQFSAGEVSFVNLNHEYGLSKIAGYSISVPRMLANYCEIKEEVIDGREFFRRIQSNDEIAQNCLRDYLKQLTILLFNLQTIFSPEAITIGGGISSQDILFTMLHQELEKYQETSYHLITKPNVLQSSLGNKANLYGALAHFNQQRKEENYV